MGAVPQAKREARRKIGNMETVRKRELFTRHLPVAARGFRHVLQAFLVLLAGLGLAACSPTYNWREVHADGGLEATLPCKPRDDTRRVTLAGRLADMRLLSCEAGSAIWAIGTADVREAGAVGEALSGLRAALGANIGSTSELKGPASIAGATPFPAAGHFAATGKRRDGSAVQAEALVFARGTRIYQASVLRPGTASGSLREAQEQFFASLAFPVPR